ncbi:hypothetical protein [Rubripirellula reticaptiva]|uniref:hypothetical protein n=1 Tax=Rubripirellula reticaptiva TaxID=2528013 RepID=UPI0016474A32|nr:hypothetical protein [Rubripirellula reticaptiva]
MVDPPRSDADRNGTLKLKSWNSEDQTLELNSRSEFQEALIIALSAQGSSGQFQKRSVIECFSVGKPSCRYRSSIRSGNFGNLNANSVALLLPSGSHRPEQGSGWIFRGTFAQLSEKNGLGPVSRNRLDFRNTLTRCEYVMTSREGSNAGRVIPLHSR